MQKTPFGVSFHHDVFSHCNASLKTKQVMTKWTLAGVELHVRFGTTELAFFSPKSLARITTMSMIARPVSSQYTKLRIWCVGLGPFPVLRASNSGCNFTESQATFSSSCFGKR